MSYEGYTQRVCPNGHSDNIDHYDAWSYDDEERESKTCLVCNEPWAWTNSVDVTNGSWDENGKRIDGYVELEVDKPMQYRMVLEDGSLSDWVDIDKVEVKPTTYKIPPSRSERIAATRLGDL